jgi:hypothetical protein
MITHNRDEGQKKNQRARYHISLSVVNGYSWIWKIQQLQLV